MDKTYLWFKRYSLPIFGYTPEWYLKYEVKVIRQTESDWEVENIYNDVFWIPKDEYNKLEEIIRE